MPRIRTVKPSFFKNEHLADLPIPVRLLFIGLWTLADKEGRLEDRPKRIKAEVFPYDNLDIDPLVSRLQSAGFIIRYGVGDLKVIQVVNFSKHQRITGSEAESVSEFPPPSDGNILETFGNTEETTRTTGRERKGKERKGETFSPPTLEEVQAYFQQKGYQESIARKAFEYYAAADWKDSRGNAVKNWKQKMISVWFKDDNKILEPGKETYETKLSKARNEFKPIQQ